MNPIAYHELSNPQKRIWLTELLNNRLDMSNIGYLVELKGKYDLTLLAQAIRFVVKTNDSLQLRFNFSETDKSELVQFVPPYEEIPISIIEVTTEEELFDKIETLHRQQFDIQGKNLCSFAVFSIDKKRFGFFEKAHHLAADGISATIVARETIDIYQKLENHMSPEPREKYSYFDFLADETNYIGSEKYNNDKQYWIQRFEDYDGEEINFSAVPNKKNSLKVKRRSFQIPPHMVEPLETFKTTHRTTNFGLFMAALGIYFNRFFNHNDMIIGMPVHNRSKKIFKEMVGMFVSTLPFRIRFQDSWNFHELMADIKKELWNALKYQGYPYNHLVKDLKDTGIDAGHFLNVQLIELPGMNHPAVEKRAFFSMTHNISQFSIYLNQQNNPNLDELDISIDYHVDIFEPREIDAIFHRLMIILDQAVKDPLKPISELPLLEETEYRHIIYDLNNTAMDFPSDKTLSRLFEETAEKYPGRIALEYEGKTVTYKDLNETTDKLAAKLQHAGIIPDTIVGILCHRSIEAITFIIGILKAGGAYLPIDPDYPLERKNYIISNSRTPVLLVEKILEHQEAELLKSITGVKTMILDYTALKEEPVQNGFHKPDLGPENLAYVIYTSGTTGKPKGTLLRHRSAVNYISWGAGVYVGSQPLDFPLFTSLSFDLTVTSTFIPLITGSKLVIYRENKEGLLIEQVIKENKADVVKLTPSHLKIVHQMKYDMSRIKSFIVGGEDLKTELSREITHRFNGNINIYNEYGPTETAVGCMIHRFDPDKDTGMSVPIGKPAGNVQVYILDKNRNPMPIGIIGEIYISGEGVALGYLHNPSLTEERFVDNPFIPGKKMYKSGDLGRWNMNEILEFFGRCDEQVKIRGFRIEPGEIEKHLVKIDGIKDGVIGVRKGPQPELCAYIVSEENRSADVAFLREQLSRELPIHMIPSEFVQVDAIPLTRNGKVDFRKLDTIGKKLDSGKTYEAPRTEMETMLSEIWAGVLGVEQVGITDNFYEMGGDSIKAVQVAARLNDVGKTINVKDILTHQTIAAVCAHVDFDSHIRKYEQGLIQGEKKPTPIEAWFLSQAFPIPHHYHQSVFLQFKNPIHIPFMEKSLEKIITFHDGLRLNVNHEKNGFYFNNSLLDKPFKLNIIDLSGVPAEQREKTIESMSFNAKGDFDITGGPMLQTLLFRTQPEPDKLLLILHHLVSDGLTLRIVLDDLFKFYNSLNSGKDIEAPQKTASLFDWYDALEIYRSSGKPAKEKNYWQDVDAARFSLPYDHDPAKADWSSKNQGTSVVRLNEEKTQYLLKNAHEVYKTDVQILAATALVRTLRQWTGKTTIKIEMENHGRHIEGIDTSKTTGWFTAIYPLLVNRDDKTIGDEIKSVKEAIRTVPNNGIGYGIAKYMPETGLSAKPGRAETRFNYLGQFDREVENALFSFCPLSTGPDVSPGNHMTAAIEINAMILNDSFKADILYNKTVLNETTMASFGDHYIKNLEEILDHIKNENDVHFTPSDFDTVDLSEDDLAALFE